MVLVVIDDSDSMLQLMKHDIEYYGHVCYVFHNPLEALAEVKKLRPHMVIVDYLMFDMLGTEVCRKILEMGINTKVMLYSALFDDEAPKRCVEMGIEFIEKKDIRVKLQQLL